MINIHEMYLQLVQKSTLSQIKEICQFLRNGNRYNVQIFMVNYYSNGLLNDIPLICVA